MHRFKFCFWFNVCTVFIYITQASVKAKEPTNAEKKSDNNLDNTYVVVGEVAWDCRQLDACSDKFGLEAILLLHQRLDDDANGNVDITESDDFLRDELKYANSYERQKGFHRNDKQITADELWLAWKSSEVHNWTVEETVQWLTVNLELPQYAKNFEEHSIDGTALPRLAVNNMHFLSSLGIKDPIHKQKISLKAMDVVLFGPSKNHNYLKDVLLALSLIIGTGGCWFAYIQNKRAQSHLRKTMKDMDSLQHAEESLKALQMELDKAKQEQEMVVTEKKNLERRLQDEITTVKHQDSYGLGDDQSRIQELEEELKTALDNLQSAERALQEKSWIPSPMLQHWLQLTYELEIKHHNGKRAAAEQQLAAAKEGCEKLRKKRSSFLGTFRVAHGSSIDDVDNRILQAKAALSEITNDIQERMHRWKQIEILCGVPIMHNPGIHHLQSLLGTGIGGLVPPKVPGHIPRTNSEGTLADDESVSSFPSGVSARSLANIPVVCNQRPGTALGAGELYMRKLTTCDLKSVASSSAILQRSDAFCAEPSEFYSTDGTEYDSTEDKSSIYSAYESSRPVFTLGERDILRSPHSMGVRRRGNEITKGKSKLNSTLPEIEHHSAEQREAPFKLCNIKASTTVKTDRSSSSESEASKVAKINP